MESYNKRFLKELNTQLDSEIEDLDELIDILSDEDSVTDVEDKNLDVLIMEVKRKSLSNVKGMIQKASLKIDGVDNEVLMTTDEKKVFYKLIRFMMFFRRIFKRNR